MYILYSSDKGLCGSLNTKLFNTLTRSKKWQEAEKELLWWKKAFNLAKANNIEVKKYFEAIPEKLDLDSILNVSDFIITSYLSGEYQKFVLLLLTM